MSGKDDLISRLRMEAEAHAQEARTQRATVHKIYQHVTGATGEPADWNGAVPVIAEIDRLRAEKAELVEALQMTTSVVQAGTRLMPPNLKFTDEWAHLGTRTISEILDAANEALGKAEARK